MELTLLGVFIAGFLSFFSPCILPLIPAYIGYIAGNSDGDTNKLRNLSRTLGFVLGFSIIFILMGATASFLGSFMIQNKSFLAKFGGIIIFILGVQMTGVININFLNIEKRSRMPKVVNWFSSVLIGMAFAAGWTPCIGPILGTILIYASTQETVQTGILLLFVYSLGIGIPFIITSVAIDQFNKLILKFETKFSILKKVSGFLIAIIGILMFMNKLSFITNLFY